MPVAGALVHVFSDVAGRFAKQPTEAYAIGIDFSARLASGEDIDTTAVSAVRVSDNTTVTSTVIESGSVTDSGGVVTIPVKAGTDGEDYRIKCVVVTDATTPATHEADVLMRVREE